MERFGIWPAERGLTTDWAHEPLIHFARDALRQPELGPVLYWQLNMENYIKDATGYQATLWRTVPDYQGGELSWSVFSSRHHVVGNPQNSSSTAQSSVSFSPLTYHHFFAPNLSPSLY